MITKAAAPPRYIHTLVIVIGFIVVACRRSRDDVPFPVVDMVREFERAEKHPSSGCRTSVHSAGGLIRPSILMPVPSRAIWSLPLPRGGRFRSFLAVSSSDNGATVQFRFGVSDLRIYEALAQQTITAGRSAWVDFGADLSAYAGTKFSLFYRPDSMIWRVVLATDALGASSATAVWGSPEIVTDLAAAKEYAARRQRLR
jgi:hypothetical protein